MAAGLLTAVILMLFPWTCIAFNCIHQGFCDYRYLSALSQVLLVQLDHIWLAPSVHSQGSIPFMGTVVTRRCIWMSLASDAHLVTGDALFLRGPPPPCRSSPPPPRAGSPEAKQRSFLFLRRLTPTQQNESTCVTIGSRVKRGF